MGKTDPLLPCPHCGKEMRAGSLTRHAPICVKNPAAFARYCEVLAAAPGSKQGIICGRYVQLSSADKTLPTVITLRRLAGAAKWDDVLAVFGLEPPAAEERRTQCMHCGKFVSGAAMADHLQECLQKIIDAREAAKAAKAAAPRKQRKPINIFAPRKPRTPKPPTTCPACGMQRIHMHCHVCPEDPEIVAWLAAHLPDPDDPSLIITYRTYKEIKPAAISVASISRAYGNWEGLAARYGLKLRSQCRAPNDAPQLDQASLAELHRLAIELHAGEYGPSHGEYTMHVAGKARPAEGLKKMFGTWKAVIEAAGLRHGSHSYYVRAANTRRRAHEAARGPQGPVASLYERDDEPVSRVAVGLPVTSAQKPRIISQPDEVYKGYVRTMIR